MALDGVLRKLRRLNLGSAGQQFAQQNYDPRFPSLSLERAQEYDTQSRAASAAVDAPFGSIASRSNPFNYGSVASREFKAFGDTDNRRQFDAMSTGGTSSPGLRRRTYGALARLAGDEDGY